ncbi:glycoside hydrolase family 61 protein [Colletotrichum sojae]|uniref:lytic cellulose monooxygenase (C4-dehydrogenating) n=1 Tax=Colletotrichum sojae TaxID=2175907 RepID=A0A8H6IV29_9PEZI|nr:glycoside hydrolase family 61 protein [Colletotrichum sojae]
MAPRKTSRLLAALASATSVAAHGHITNIVVKGVSYRNYLPTQDPYTPNPPLVAGWATDQPDNGYVEPSAYNAPDIICHRKAVAGKGRIVVEAGDTIQLQWTDWPDSHKGPVLDWLAPCNGPCNAIPKTDLRFFKIDGAGLIDAPQRNNRWAAADLIGNGNAWLVRIPPNIAPGHYVLRHDIIALHGGQQPNGAQSYPQCINLEITGSGTDTPEGVPGTALYGANDPGILYNIYRDFLNDYIVPGGPIIPGGTSMLPQSKIPITASGSATPYGTTRASSSARASNSSPAPVVSSSSRAPAVLTSLTPVQSPASSSPRQTDDDTLPKTSFTPSATTLQTRTTAAPPASSQPPPSGEEVTQGLYQQCGGRGYAGATKCQDFATCSTMDPYYAQCRPTPVASGGGQPLYAQCGGIGYTGPTNCVAGARCQVINAWYSQCLP